MQQIKSCRRQLHRPKKLTLARFLGLDRGPFLCSRSVDLRNISYLFHGLHGLRARHQRSRSTVFDGAPRSYRQRNGRHTLIVRDIRDENEIKVAEAIPCAYHFASDSLARLVTNRFDTILRILHLSRPGLRRIGPLVHIERHVVPPWLSWRLSEVRPTEEKIMHSEVDAPGAKTQPASDRSHNAILAA